MKLWFNIVLSALLSYSCSSQNNTKNTEQKSDIKHSLIELKKYEQSLKRETVMSKEKAVEYADKCLDIAHQYPKTKEAPQMMNKAHIVLSSVGLYQRSVIIADSIILMYPMYEKRAMVLESLASSYDIFIVPRNKEKVKHYYEMLLMESKIIDQSKRESIENRLKFIDLPFEEYILKQRKE